VTDQPRITPRTLKGFRDFLPDAMQLREWVIERAKAVYRRYGYSPIDTPALEYTEILLGKGSDETDKQLYRFSDNGGRDVALRFDLTVPLARYVAQHIGTLGTPFKRYHVGPVWRGENTQRGRYREFLQCDFDTIGTESLVADIETGLVVHDLFTELGFERFTIRLNDRRVLNGVLERHGIADRSTAVLRALDKLGKIGVDGVRRELLDEVGVSADQASGVLELAALGADHNGVVAALPDLVAGSEVGERGAADLTAVVSGMLAAGADPDRIAIDVSTARGLDYYTGIVLETFLDDLPKIGSCCSGGRYDDLASVYTKQRLPGVGASLGVDRLLAAMEELDMGEKRHASADVLVVLFEADRSVDYVALAARLRTDGISVELYPEPRKLGAQLKYADRRGHRYAVIVGGAEWETDTAQVKALNTGESWEFPMGDLSRNLASLIHSGRPAAQG
jgi:histidyl-tRNA synthetase